LKHQLYTGFLLLLFTVFSSVLPYCRDAQDNDSDSLLQIIRLSSDDSLKVGAITEFTSLILDTEPDSAYFLLEEADKILRTNPVLHLQIKANNAKSLILQNIGKYPEALELQFEIKKLMEDEDGRLKSIVNPNDYLNTINNIGLIFYKTEKYNDATDYFENALDLLKNTEDSLIKDANKEYLRFNLNIGAVHTKQRDFEKAEFYFTKALQYLDENNLKNYAVLLNNLSIVARENGNFEKAYELNLKAIKVSEESGNYRILVQAFNNMGNYYLVIRNFPRAMAHFRKALQLAEKYGFGSSVVISLDMLASAYDSIGDYQNAYETNLKFKHYSDSLLDLEKLRMVTQLEMKDKFDKRLATARIAQKEREAEQKKRELIYTLIIIFALMGLIILVLLFYLQRSKSKRHRLEAEKNALLSKSLELEKTKLTEELEFKKKELATNVMYMIRKNELIHDIVQKLQQFAQSGKKPGEREILEIINSLEKAQDQALWNEFEIRFQQVHNDFYDWLNTISPDLTVNERRLCAFLRLNMTTKEISSITGQSPRTIDVARTRLRKKLNLTNSEIGLVEFLSAKA
jgi:tetratricopeptide (TPR) repeat protein